MSLRHRRQPKVWGCIYHALYAVTGDESLLEHADDLSEFRALTRLHALGYGVYTLHAAMFGGAQPTTPEFWREVTAQIPAGEAHVLLMTVEGVHPDLRHAVAMALCRDEAVISDSALPELIRLSLPDFLETKYARASEVQSVFPLDLDALPVQPAQATLDVVMRHYEEARAAAYAM